MKEFRSGHMVSQGHYSAFVPTPVNRDWRLDDVSIIRLLGEAERAIGKLDMFSEYVPNVELFIGMHATKEAVQSTRIEGTQTHFEEAFQSREEIPEQRRADWDEVQNYISAMNLAMERMSELPFASRLIRAIHRELLKGVRGEHKMPGEFRTSQNWIGGASINDAAFVPPPPAMVGELMGDIEKFANNDAIHLPALIKIALIHYQFETIHPFLDGNGRIGRLLIPVYLVDCGLLKRPVLYISDFFERHRRLYYDNLTGVRSNSDLSRWVKFFLTGIVEVCESGIRAFDSVLKLQEEVKAKTGTLKSRAYTANLVIDHLYHNPYLATQDVVRVASLPPSSAYSLVRDLERLGILREITGGKRGRRYVFEQYIDIFK